MIYQVSRDEDTSSSCSECKKEANHIHQQSSEESEQVEPSQNLLSRHTHSHAHPLVSLLQDENKRLKLINQDQEREIKELRIQLEMSKIKNFGNSEMARSTRQLPKFKVEGQISPKGVNRLYSPSYKAGKAAQPQTSLLQVALLEKQLKQFQLKVLQLTTKLREYEQRECWMHKFIVSFVNMAEELSVNYGGKLMTKGAPLRKKTKMSWKYIKELINYLIK